MPSDALPHEDFSPLCRVAKDALDNRDAQALQKALADGFDPREPNPDGIPWLALAASRAFLDGARLLLPLSDASVLDPDGRDALMHAAIASSPECVEFLAPYSDPLRRDINGYTALMRAAASRRPRAIDCVKLLAPLSDLDAVDESESDALLHAVNAANAAGQSGDTVSFLASISSQKSLNAPRRVSWRATPLIAAVMMQAQDAILALIPHCDLAAKNSAGKTALGVAAEHSRLGSAAVLIPRCDSPIRDEAFEIALSAAVFSQGENAPRDRQWATLDLFAPFLSEEQIERAFRGSLALTGEFAGSIPQIRARREAIAQRDELNLAIQDNDARAPRENGAAAREPSAKKRL